MQGIALRRTALRLPERHIEMQGNQLHDKQHVSTMLKSITDCYRQCLRLCVRKVMTDPSLQQKMSSCQTYLELEARLKSRFLNRLLLIFTVLHVLSEHMGGYDPC